MLDSIVKWSIAQRWLVVIASIIISLWGFRVLSEMPLDVFPNFAPPQVEIMTEAEGLAPDEVESLVTRPIESAINGTPGIETLRSGSGAGKEILQPLAIVVLCGLFTSTALTLLVLPALYIQFGKFLVPKTTQPIINTEIAASPSF